jgi:uncharacterized membrane protein (DUF4010 family)
MILHSLIASGLFGGVVKSTYVLLKFVAFNKAFRWIESFSVVVLPLMANWSCHQRPDITATPVLTIIKG